MIIFDYAIKFTNASEKINNFYEECLSILFNQRDSFSIDPNLFYELAPSCEEYATVTATIAAQIALLCNFFTLNWLGVRPVTFLNNLVK